MRFCAQYMYYSLGSFAYKSKIFLACTNRKVDISGISSYFGCQRLSCAVSGFGSPEESYCWDFRTDPTGRDLKRSSEKAADQ